MADHRKRLETQFNAMEQAMSKSQSQQQAIAGLTAKLNSQ